MSINIELLRSVLLSSTGLALTFGYSPSRMQKCSRIAHSLHIAISYYKTTCVTKFRILPSSVNTASEALVSTPSQKFQHSIMLVPLIVGKWTEMVGKASNDQVLAKFCDNRSTVSRVQTGDRHTATWTLK